eukprot:1747291-Prymnesium_polylepis.1
MRPQPPTEASALRPCPPARAGHTDDGVVVGGAARRAVQPATDADAAPSATALAARPLSLEAIALGAAGAPAAVSAKPAAVVAMAGGGGTGGGMGGAGDQKCASAAGDTRAVRNRGLGGAPAAPAQSRAADTRASEDGAALLAGRSRRLRLSRSLSWVYGRAVRSRPRSA